MSSINALVSRCIRLLDQSRATTHYGTAEHFARALTIWSSVLLFENMDIWLKKCSGLERGLSPLAEILAILMTHANTNYEDVLGRIYMELSQGDPRLGQYFTPHCVSEALSQVLLDSHGPLPAPGELPMSIIEPACGSGAIILAKAEVIERRHPGAIWRGQVEFAGVDLDPICVAMANLNMRLYGIGRMTRADSLVETERHTLKNALGIPPVMAFQQAQIVRGNSLDPSCTELFNAPNPWTPPPIWLDERMERAAIPPAERSAAASKEEHVDSAIVSREAAPPPAATPSAIETGLPKATRQQESHAAVRPFTQRTNPKRPPARSFYAQPTAKKTKKKSPFAQGTLFLLP